MFFFFNRAQSRIKELQSCMEERQASAADTMKEVVEEAKAITKEYYEAQIQTLRDEVRV